MNDLLRNELKDAVELLVDECHAASLNAGWWYDLQTDIDLRRHASEGTRFGKALVAEKLCLIHSEVSEAMEGHRKDLVDEKLPEFDAITVELADACIRIFDLAGALGLHLGDALAAKMAYNATREDHKPENRAKPGGKAY